MILTKDRENNNNIALNNSFDKPMADFEEGDIGVRDDFD